MKISMDMYNLTLEEAKGDIDGLCYNWNIIKLCYELWWDEIVDTYGENIKLHKIAGVGVNYINEICSCKIKMETCKKTFNAGMESGVIQYVRGKQKIIEITIVNDYIIWNTVYNELINKKRKVSSIEDEKKKNIMLQKIKNIEKWIDENYDKKRDLKEHINILKERILKMISEEPLIIYGEKRNTPVGAIKNYLLGKTTKESLIGEQQEKLFKVSQLMFELNCHEISKFTDEYLYVLKESIKVISDRVNAECDYRSVRKREREILEKSS